MKYLYITFSDDEVWKVPAIFIAEVRAKYYVEFDISRGDVKIEDKEKNIAIETEYALKDDFEIIDWAKNNMNWSDVKDKAQFDHKINCLSTKQELWSDAEMEIRYV